MSCFAELQLQFSCGIFIFGQRPRYSKNGAIFRFQSCLFFTTEEQKLLTNTANAKPNVSTRRRRRGKRDLQDWSSFNKNRQDWTSFGLLSCKPSTGRHNIQGQVRRWLVIDCPTGQSLWSNFSAHLFPSLKTLVIYKITMSKLARTCPNMNLKQLTTSHFLSIFGSCACRELFRKKAGLFAILQTQLLFPPKSKMVHFLAYDRILSLKKNSDMNTAPDLELLMNLRASKTASMNAFVWSIFSSYISFPS